MLRPNAGEERRRNFKTPTTAEEARRKRETEALRLRAETRNEVIQKKRNVGGATQSWGGAGAGGEPLMDGTEHSSARVRGAAARRAGLSMP
jgi:hypothetical protein